MSRSTGLPLNTWWSGAWKVTRARIIGWRRAYRSSSCDLDSKVVGKVFGLHFFCRGNSVLFHHLILAQKIVGLYKGMGASGFQEFVPRLLSRVIMG
jgi:hypothetical protein